MCKLFIFTVCADIGQVVWARRLANTLNGYEVLYLLLARRLLLVSRVLQVSVPEPGQLVDVRRRRYVVMDIAQSPLPLDILTPGNSLQSQHLVTLSSVEDDALGEELQVIWEIEPGATAIDKTPLPRPVGFDTPQRLDTFLNAVKWGAASSADIKAIQAPFRSGIDLEDYH